MNTLKLEAELAEKYKYKPLSPELSERYRAIYRENIPDWLDENGASTILYSKNGTIICEGYTRIVIGDYGAFVEFDRSQANIDNIMVKPGQEYRITEPRYINNVKYVWLTTDDESDVKIYHQRKTVAYADYKVDMFYVSPHECYRESDFDTSVEPRITLKLDKIPEHCGECTFYRNNSCKEIHCCPFGADTYGCLVERPKNCPIGKEIPAKKFLLNLGV